MHIAIWFPADLQPGLATRGPCPKPASSLTASDDQGIQDSERSHALPTVTQPGRVLSQEDTLGLVQGVGVLLWSLWHSVVGGKHLPISSPLRNAGPRACLRSKCLELQWGTHHSRSPKEKENKRPQASRASQDKPTEVAAGGKILGIKNRDLGNLVQACCLTS